MALATRIIPVLLSKRGALVKGRRFSNERVVGHALQAVRIYQGRGVDELLFLDVTATAERRGPDITLVRQLTSEMFAPLTVGGGVSTLDHFRELLKNGADKVAINSAAVENPAIIAAAAEKFGRQAVTVSIDVKDGYVQTHCGTCRTDLRPVEWARECERLGAGEILLTSVDRDGTMAGYDTDLISAVSSVVSVPVVACGGAGTYLHLKEGLDAGAHAVAAGAMWQFSDCTPAGAAEYLHKAGVRVRRKLAA
jgi:cyclase